MPSEETTVEILEGFRRRDAGDVRVLGARGRLGVVRQPRDRADDRSRERVLKRIRGTPVPPWIVFAGRIGTSFVSATIVTATLCAIGWRSSAWTPRRRAV
jgi:hypothetical protein